MSNKDKYNLTDIYTNMLNEQATPYDPVEPQEQETPAQAFVRDLSETPLYRLQWTPKMKQFILQNKQEVMDAMDYYDWDPEIIELFTKHIGENKLRPQQ